MPQRVRLMGIPQGLLCAHRSLGSSFISLLWRVPTIPEPQRPNPTNRNCALGAKLRARFSVVKSGRVKAALAQRLLRDSAIIPRKRLVGEHLIVLVSLASEQHDIACTRFIERESNGFLAVRFDQIFSAALLHPDHNIANDLERIFLARIVIGQNGEVRKPATDFAHDRAFAAVFATATPEKSDYAALWIQLARSLNQILECIVGMRKINNDKERLAHVHPLKAARNTFQGANSRFDDFI